MFKSRLKLQHLQWLNKRIVLIKMRKLLRIALDEQRFSGSIFKSLHINCSIFSSQEHPTKRNVTKRMKDYYVEGRCEETVLFFSWNKQLHMHLNQTKTIKFKSFQVLNENLEASNVVWFDNDYYTRHSFFVNSEHRQC